MRSGRRGREIMGEGETGRRREREKGRREEGEKGKKSGKGRRR